MDVRLFQQKLGHEIRRRRQQLALSQEDFADRIEVHRTYIGSVERGERNVSLKNLLRIAEALNISLSTLIACVEVDATH